MTSAQAVKLVTALAANWGSQGRWAQAKFDLYADAIIDYPFELADRVIMGMVRTREGKWSCPLVGDICQAIERLERKASERLRLEADRRLLLEGPMPEETRLQVRRIIASLEAKAGPNQNKPVFGVDDASSPTRKTDAAADNARRALLKRQAEALRRRGD